jgi:glycerol-3-phosphate dehydrogenase
MDEDASGLLRMAVYPVPPLDGSGLGVHLTPSTNGNIIIGPSADYIDDRDDVRNTKSVMEILKKEAFELLPALRNYPFIKNYAGIRPKLFNSKKTTNFEDFIIEESMPGFINLIGIESPGLTSAPAIAEYILDKMISKKIGLIQKKEFNQIKIGLRQAKYLNFNELKKIYKKDKNYGDIICRCNRITKAEILHAINNPLKCLTLDVIKKRTQAMMGRCQGGFCLPKIIDILIKEYDINPEQILKGKKDSKLFFKD